MNVEQFYSGDIVLNNPFQTTRKMKVPLHSRRGHSERMTVKLFKALIALSIVAAIVTIICQLMF